MNTTWSRWLDVRMLRTSLFVLLWDRRRLRAVEVFARRLQTRETKTVQIADITDEALQPEGFGMMIEAEHQCMSLRDVRKLDVVIITSKFTGLFLEDISLRDRFVRMVRG